MKNNPKFNYFKSIKRAKNSAKILRNKKSNADKIAELEEILLFGDFKNF
jgi:hypothetical protein